MDKNKDYYAILGVLPSAEDIVIRAAYKALALRYHPDRFAGDSNQAKRKMSEINEAYEILSDPRKRSSYDSLRDLNTKASYFDGEESDPPPRYDPLEQDWLVALKYYPDLQELESSLSKIAWRLAYSYKAFLLSEKRFDSRKTLAEEMRRNFLELYFGKSPKLVAFAYELIQAGNKQAAKALNEAVRVLGSKADPDHLIGKIKTDFQCKAAGADSDVSGTFYWTPSWLLIVLSPFIVMIIGAALFAFLSPIIGL